MEHPPTLDVLRIQAQNLQTGSVFTEHPKEKLPFTAGEVAGVVLVTALVLGVSRLRR